MKKLIILFLFLTFPFGCFSITPHFDNQDWIYGQIYSENKNMVCDFTYYFSNKEIEIELGASGYLIKPTYVNEREDTIEFGFFKVWIGAEEINNNDSRELAYYIIIVSQENINNSKKGNLQSINNIKPVLILEDSAGSILRHCNKAKEFNVKLNCYLYEKAELNCKKIREINSNDTFSIIDLVLSEENDEDVWVKIDFDGTIGYIPLTSLADDWKVIKNDLNKYTDVAHIQAFCNDNRVRIRKQPNLNCETLGYLNKGDKVYIKGNSEKKQTIDNESWYWNQVELPDGITGWVYGKYLDIEK